MNLQDNSIVEEKWYKMIDRFVDKPLSAISNANELLIYPHSFNGTTDKINDLSLFTRFQGEVWTTNLMGFLSLGGKDISITSRFCQDGNKDYILYYLLHKVMHINVFNLPHGSSSGTAVDFLMFLFPRLLNEAVTQGLYKEYRRFEYNDTRVRGTVDVNRYIREDIPFQGKVAYRTREFSYDNAVTQLVRHTIEYMRHHSFGHGILNNDADTRAAVSQIVLATPSYSQRDRINVINKNLRPVRHPYYTKYRELQSLCLRILRHEKLNYGNQKDKIHGILFDGAWLWEEYIASLLKEQFMHYTESNSHFKLFEQDDGRDFQKIIPDYMTRDYDDTSGEGAQAVADAKYMRLEDKLRLQGEQAYSVYYKTIMYMHRFNAKKGFIFYPVAQDEKISEDAGKADSNTRENIFREYTIKNTESKFIMAGLRIPPSGGNLTFEKFQGDMRVIEIQYVKQIKRFLNNNDSRIFF